MKIGLVCHDCIDVEDQPFYAKVVSPRDDGCYMFICPAGHNVGVVLQQEQFEVLFEIGTHALVDGYHRDAVSTCAAALERFYEFAIRVFCLHTGKLFDEAWKRVASQSERQLGAYLFLYVHLIGALPPLPSTKDVEFRNAVVHKGKMPTYEEAFNYCERVKAIFDESIAVLKRDYAQELEGYTTAHMFAKRAIVAKGGGKLSFMSLPTTVTLIRAEETFAVRVAQIQKVKANRSAD